MNTTTIKILILIFFFKVGFIHAQDVTTVNAVDSEISKNLDLEVVAALFGDCENLEEFEEKLNDPHKKISNLDLNEDGEVDYLRVIDTSKKDTHVVTIQAVLGENQYQDVASIDVEKDNKGETSVQVVGDVYMYGSNYIIEPVYVHQPVIYMWFWGPYYSPWYSPYYWHHYPPYYRPWRPRPVHYYHRDVRVHVNRKTTYRYTSVRKSNRAVHMHKKVHKNDFAKQYPNKSFDKRHKDVVNASQLNKSTTKTKNVAKPSTKDKKTGKVTTGQKVQNDWKPKSNNPIQNNSVQVPTQKNQSKNKSSKSNKTPTTRPSISPKNNKSYQPKKSNYSNNYSRPATRPKPAAPRPTPSRAMPARRR
ncbi:hypothetical protein [Flammeovirga kamogawensis]|uniref:DUF3300 domain-containing protein n=1 Tax=Flammeovirga kamogawensis TaxID=373891 RepID=A0ABX8H3E0_9BACT|nr:hypothetical protein [Flammeovirga kamogawensis]MBB6460330.1 hypothetical protein [Flammeovirga kamogawensis]QWG10139.1 hypothetical protein KM029_20875 [Flammeovirga kamogawensis]TRX65648.1 hypothetical protein EO216_24310 [Flammeovirga kamogawensis]